MKTIVTFLFELIQSLLTKIEELNFIIESLTPKKPPYDSRSPKYKHLSVDKPPVVRTFEKQDYRKLLKEHERLFGKPLKPVSRRWSADRHSMPLLRCPSYVSLRQQWWPWPAFMQGMQQQLLPRKASYYILSSVPLLRQHAHKGERPQRIFRPQVCQQTL